MPYLEAVDVPPLMDGASDEEEPRPDEARLDC